MASYTLKESSWAMEHHPVLLPKSCGEDEDRRALLHLINSCRGWKDLNKARDAHSYALQKKHSFSKDSCIANALFSAYCRCKAPSEARKLFDDIPEVHNSSSWNALIVAYAKHGMPYEAITCFRKIWYERNIWYESNMLCKSNVWHKSYTWYAMWYKSNMWHENNMLHGSNMWYQSILWYKRNIWYKSNVGYQRNMWYKKNVWSKSYMCTRNIWSKRNMFYQSIFSPGPYTLVCLLKACGQTRNLELGEEIFAEVCKRKLLERNVFLCNALLDMYAKCGFILKVQKLFDELRLRDVVTWNSLISGYVLNGYAHKALNCFKQMRDEGVPPDEVTFICILKACGNVRSLEMGEEMHAEIQKQTKLLETNVDVGNMLMAMYAKCSMLERAQEVFDKLPMRNVASWNVLIDGYAKHGLSNEALKHFEWMQREGFGPDKYTYVSVLNACANIGSIEIGEEVHAMVTKKKLLEKNLILGNAIVHMYAKCGMLRKAQKAFNELTERDIISWNALISGYAQHGFNDEALNCFMQLRDECVSPDAITFVCVLNACRGVGLLKMGEEIYGEICKQGLLEDNVMLGNALIDMYAKCCVLGRAQEVFDKLRTPDVISWNALISGYAQLGEARKVFYLFSMMLREATILPDIVTLVILLTVCSHGGLVEEGQTLLDHMLALYNVNPTVEHYTCMVDLFGRAGRIDKAMVMLEKVPDSDHLPMWLALLGACYKWVNVDLGKWAFEQSVMLDEKCAIAYVCMGNIYAAAKMYKEAMGIEAQRLEKEACHYSRNHESDICTNMYLFTGAKLSKEM